MIGNSGSGSRTPTELVSGSGLALRAVTKTMQTEKVVVKVGLRRGSHVVYKLVEVDCNFGFPEVTSLLKTTFQTNGTFELSYNDEQGDSILMDCTNDLNLYFKHAIGNLRWEYTEKETVPLSPAPRPTPVFVVQPPFSQAISNATQKYQQLDYRPQSNVKTVALPKLNARFVTHVTCDDERSTYGPGDKFFKTWRFRNDGQLKWPKMINVLFVSKLTGDSMGGPEELPIIFPEQIEIGKEIDITVPLVAPQQSGEYTGFWKLADESGRKFGQRVRVRIHVAELDPCYRLSETQIEMVRELEESGFQASNTVRTIMTRVNPPETLEEIEKELRRLGIRQSLN